jgi:alkaline phosphatase
MFVLRDLLTSSASPRAAARVLSALPVLLLAGSAAHAGDAAPAAKNVILLISDGAGPTTWTAANQWQFGPDADLGSPFVQPYESPNFSKHWMTTYPANTLPLPPGQVDVRLGLPAGSLPRYLPQLWNELPIPDNGAYNPVAANDLTPGPVRLFASANGVLLDRGPIVNLTPVPTNPPFVQFLANTLEANGTVVAVLDSGFLAYDYLIWNSTTDSAAAGTALASGQKTYNSAINFIDTGTTLEPVDFITQQVKAAGKRAGVVTTKPFTDATPAAFGTQNDYRDDEAEISNDMINNGLLDVIITPGHPEFGSGGVPQTPSYSVISQSNLNALRGGVDGWTLVETVPGLTGIADGSIPAPERLFGLVPVSSALNSRNTAGRTNAYDPRFFDPQNPNGAVPFVMPDLADLTNAALRTLEQSPRGFFLMVEGASVDSNAHANELAGLVEEQLAFNRAVDSVIAWVEANSSWEETLVIVTTDHANALFLGPQSDTIPFQQPVATGAGSLPQGIFWSTNHTNELVPLWTRGPGSGLFASLTDGVDPTRGAYIDNTDVYTVMSTVMPQCLTDLSPNGTTDGADLALLLGAWGTADAIGDLNEDGTVDGADLAIMLGAWGTCG